MAREEKQLLLKDLSARLPYGVKGLAYIVGDPCLTNTNIVGIINESIVTDYESPMLDLIDFNSKDIIIKPYLRPLSSMTEEEAITIFKIIYGDDTEFSSVEVSDNCIEIWDYDYNEDGFSERTVCTIYFDEIVRSMEVLDYILSRHFDIPHWDESENTYKTMIEKGLALEAPEGMYKLKQ